jgi:hypothetical protein
MKSKKLRWSGYLMLAVLFGAGFRVAEVSETNAPPESVATKPAARSFDVAVADHSNAGYARQTQVGLD